MPRPKTKAVTVKNIPVDLWERVKVLSERSGVRIEMLVRQALVLRVDSEIER